MKSKQQSGKEMTALIRKNIWFKTATWSDLKEKALDLGLSPSEAVEDAVDDWLDVPHTAKKLGVARG
jgi:hypothetical protein